MSESSENEYKYVVRISTSAWYDDRGVHIRKDIKLLKRLSKLDSNPGYDILREECNAISAMQFVDNIENLSSCEDGIYQLIICNVSTDYETGIADDWNYELIPFENEL